MGIGDQLMAAGEAARLHRKTGKKVCIVDRRNVPQWSPLWDGIPYIVKARSPGTLSMVNAPGSRPYIASKNFDRWTWRAYVPEPAELVLTAAEKRFAEPYRGMVMLEPNIKDGQGHANKAWPWRRWQELADALQSPEAPIVQCGAPGSHWLDGVMRVETPDIRHAIAVLAVARVFVGTEGALHHAAAAVRTPAVVLFAEFISPESTGYATQTNLRHAGPACGKRSPCANCAASMEAILVSEVLTALRPFIQHEVTP